MSGKNIEPAKQNYFFGASYEDLGRTIKKAFSINKQSARKSGENIKYAWENKGIFGKIASLAKNSISIIIILFLGTAYTIFFSIFHIGIVFCIMLLFYIVFSIAWLVDRIYLLIHKVRTDCPNCHSSALIPWYRCSSCGEIHKQLVPGKYGVWRHTCNCGEKLPSTFLNGRSQITSICPYCESELVASEVRPIVFQLIGGSGSGKTIYLASFYHAFLEKVKSNSNVQYEITEQYQPYFDDLERWFGGELCPSTNQLNSQMYPLLVETGKGIKRQFSVYDIAGEMFSGDNIRTQEIQRQFQYCDGLLFVIDPYSSEEFRVNDVSKVDMQDFSEVSANEVATNFINYFISTNHVNATKRSDKKLSVIITKADVKEIKKEIGPAKINAIYSAHPEQYRTKGDCRNQVCRQYLVNMGFSSAVEELEIHFRNIQYYPISAMGHSQDGTEYEPWGIMEPFEWMLPGVDKKLATAIGIGQEV